MPEIQRCIPAKTKRLNKAYAKLTLRLTPSIYLQKSCHNSTKRAAAAQPTSDPSLQDHPGKFRRRFLHRRRRGSHCGRPLTPCSAANRQVKLHLHARPECLKFKESKNCMHPAQLWKRGSSGTAPSNYIQKQAQIHGSSIIFSFFEC